MQARACGQMLASATAFGTTAARALAPGPSKARSATAFGTTVRAARAVRTPAKKGSAAAPAPNPEPPKEEFPNRGFDMAVSRAGSQAWGVHVKTHWHQQ